MSKAKDVSRLSELAQLMLDHRLGQLRASADQLEQSRMQLGAINRAGDPADLDPVMAARVGLGYERWADVRRAELNLVIARQTAAWLGAQSEARTAFGRVQALQGVAERLKTLR
ncbi:MAG: hypothetical protein V4753_14880 [Pseudomonadota bacterium]